jgi:hypothetical protein
MNSARRAGREALAARKENAGAGPAFANSGKLEDRLERWRFGEGAGPQDREVSSWVRLVSMTMKR